MTTDDKHIATVTENYNNAGDYFRVEFKDAIIKRVVSIGMWPTEALLAGGGGIYRVKADENHWAKNSNPMQVMRAQSLNPDESSIEIDFYNDYQFGKETPQKFTAYFECGICVEIKEK